MSRPMYRFIGREGGRLKWQAPIKNDSRVEEISCDAAWFYGQMQVVFISEEAA